MTAPSTGHPSGRLRTLVVAGAWDTVRRMADDLTSARNELNDEFEQLRKNLKHIHDSLDKVDAAGPLDDVAQLLEDLEDTVKKVRTGGMLGGGAKGHAKARKDYLEMQGKKA